MRQQNWRLKKIIEDALHENRAALSPSEVRDLVRDSNNEIILLGVRKPEEYVKGHISGAINLDITTNDFTKAIDTFDTEVTYIIYCTKDTRSKKAFSLMQAADFSNVYRLNSGITGWEQNDYEIVQ